MNPESIAPFYQMDWDIKKTFTILAAPAITSPPHTSSKQEHPLMLTFLFAFLYNDSNSSGATFKVETTLDFLSKRIASGMSQAGHGAITRGFAI